MIIQEGINLIKSFESCKLKAYKDNTLSDITQQNKEQITGE